MRNDKRMIVLAMVCGLLGAPAALAENAYCDYRSVDGGNGSDWNQLGSWECFNGTGWATCDAQGGFQQQDACYNHVPGTGNRATILGEDIIFIAGSVQTIDELIIETHATDPGELQLKSASSASSLTISNSLTMQTGGVPGTISFVNGGSSANPGELIIDGAGITAAGDLVMNATHGGRITVTGTNTFKLTGELVAASGTLTVAGKFENDGEFTMDGTSTVMVEFAQNQSQQGGIAADSSGSWLISNPNGTLRVSTSSTVTNPNGSITLEDGTLDADADFKFNGHLTWKDNGIVDVAASKVFLAASGDLP